MKKNVEIMPCKRLWHLAGSLHGHHFALVFYQSKEDPACKELYISLLEGEAMLIRDNLYLKDMNEYECLVMMASVSRE